MKVVTKRLPKAAFVTGLVLCCAVALVVRADSSNEVSRPPCSDCHQCSSPTTANPCLKNCLNPTGEHDSAHSSKEGPGVVVLRGNDNLYQPVRFNHKLHAEMVGMGEGCTTCHHYSPEGRIPPCRECHETASGNLGKPGLKGAFHRQCMGCHREWSHDTKCIFCHLPAEGKSAAVGFDSTDIIGISHPVITVPDKRVYHTPYEPGPVVTLHHNEHIDLFGLRCVDCHKQENCSYCHDIDKETKIAKTDEEIHAICNDCHLKDRCGKCHDTVEKPAFSHASTGWTLNRFHRDAACRACHPTGKKISALNRKCTACHSGWKQGNFDHAVTSLRLDDIHIELDCEDCHTDLAYNNAPDCETCHDEGTNPQETAPGVYLKR